MNARALRRFELSLPNDVYILGVTPITLQSDIHEWRTGLITISTIVVNLPKANGSGTEIWLALGLAAVSVAIKTTDTFQGFIDIGVVGSTAKNVFTAGGLKNITLNGSTQGGSNTGDQLMFTDIKSGVWSVCAQVVGTGSPATPFS